MDSRAGQNACRQLGNHLVLFTLCRGREGLVSEVRLNDLDDQR